MKNSDEKLKDFSMAYQYLQEHKEINNVLLTGGDPMILSTNKLKNIISELRKIDHIKTIRIGTKMLSYNPFRVIDAPDLLDMLKEYSYKDKRIYIVNDINHWHEITEHTYRAVDMLLKAGTILVNQTPLLRGVNDKLEVITRLFKDLSQMGISSYYLFVNRPVVGNSTFAVPVEKGWKIFERAKTLISGLERRAKYVMSHWTGKIEVLALTQNEIIFKYQRAAKYENNGKIMIFKRNQQAVWFDDYTKLIGEFSPLEPAVEESIS